MELLYASKTNASSAYLRLNAMKKGVMVYAYDSKGFKKMCWREVYAKKSRICGILSMINLAVSAELLGLTKHYAPGYM